MHYQFKYQQLDAAECIRLIHSKDNDLIASVIVSGQGSNRTILSLIVQRQYRRKGFAVKLMHEIIERHHRVDLFLSAMPSMVYDGNGNPDPKNVIPLEALVKFYEEFGFVITDRWKLMIRMKRGKS